MKSDSQIQQDATNELKWERAINTAGIGLEVHGDIVTPVGRVDNYGETWAAEKPAPRLAGIKNRTVEIEVTLSACGARSYIDAATSVESALQGAIFLPTHALKVMVEKGWITLSASVDCDCQSENANWMHEMARDCAGNAAGSRPASIIDPNPRNDSLNRRRRLGAVNPADPCGEDSVDRRGKPWNVGILPDAGAHHP